MTYGNYGEVIPGLTIDGRQITAGVFDETQVRAAAGLTLALGATAFAYAYFGKVYEPIKLVTVLFFIEFTVRVALGIRYSPIGQLAKLMTRRHAAVWVSARPKRFAWSLGLAMSFAMAIITNVDIRGALPLTICMICMVLMWMEAVLGLCLGCEIYRFMVRRGWVARDAASEICRDGTCTVEADSAARRQTQSAALPGEDRA
jgi:hypothetical protein